MELKNYQKRVLRELDNYMALLNQTQNINQAYNMHWSQLGISVGFGGMPPYNDVLPHVPHVCFKVPTGGGKTLLGCAALRHIFSGMGIEKNRAVVWLVPSNAILEQTLAALKDAEHPYRQQLNFDFGSCVEVLDGTQALNAQNFTPATVRENLTIFVMSYDALRRKSTEGLRVYRENGNLAQFVPHYTLHDTLLPDVDETALIQVINQLSPVVIVDESHNAKSNLSIEMQKNLNPSFVLDLTATPKENSNVISIVDARELKSENMVKLPVVIYNRQSKADVLVDAIQLRGNLESQAREEQKNSGTYIRPIVLFQAQPKGGEDAATFGKLKDELVSMGIPKEYIAIKTSEVNELKGVNLMSETCPIRYIITVNALKEGWDCPFAYILATLANRTSKVDVEQIVGRVLRLPYTRKHSQPLLNMSYVITSSVNFRETVENVVKGLNQAGFSDKEYRIGSDVPAAPEPQQQHISDIPVQPEAQAQEPEEEFLGFDAEAIKERLAASDPVTVSGSVSEMAQQAQRLGEAFEQDIQQAATSGIPLMGGSDMRKYYAMQSEFEEEALSMQLPCFFEEAGASLICEQEFEPVTKEMLAEGFSLTDKDASVNFNMSHGDIAMLDVNEGNDSRPRQIPLSQKQAKELQTLVRTYPEEKRISICADMLFQRLNTLNEISASDLKAYIGRVIANMTNEEIGQMESALPTYAFIIKKKILCLIDVYREQRFNEQIETNEIVVRPHFSFPKLISPVSTVLPISKSLYTDEADMNDFEHRVINAVAGLPNVRWWHRNIERHGFYLNGFINHYPDFIVMTEKGTIVLIETKGDDRDNSDSKDKLRLGRKWQELAGSKYKYYMVFDENDTGLDGAYRVADFLDLLKKL